jgi:hypothetical protein
MALTLIGAGFGRTGTLSLKLALDKLGAGPCYHMMEVGKNPGHASQWHAAAKGEATDWDDLFADYTATVDWPACSFWKPLIAHFPDARVLLGVRDSDRWYDSVHGTIYQSMLHGDELENEVARTHLAMARKIVLEDTFGGRFEDRAHAIDVFERHNAEVKAAIPAERLLVYEVGSGWDPLSAFLNLPVPDEPYPHVNTSESFQQRMQAMATPKS